MPLMLRLHAKLRPIQVNYKLPTWEEILKLVSISMKTKTQLNLSNKHASGS